MSTPREVPWRWLQTADSQQTELSASVCVCVCVCVCVHRVGVFTHTHVNFPPTQYLPASTWFRLEQCGAHPLRLRERGENTLPTPCPTPVTKQKKGALKHAHTHTHTLAHTLAHTSTHSHSHTYSHAHTRALTSISPFPQPKAMRLLAHARHHGDCIMVLSCASYWQRSTRVHSWCSTSHTRI
jgi:hypothetical protein